MRARWLWLGAAAGLVGALATCSTKQLAPQVVVTPLRHRLYLDASGAEPFLFRSGDLTLRGWRFRAQGERRGTIVYLHGHSDNRHLSRRAAARFTPQGYDVVAYDSRAHGESEGRFCTFGVEEKLDLRRALDALGEQRVLVIGSSLGGAVALLAAAEDARIGAVVAHAPYVSLREAVKDRSGFLSDDQRSKLVAQAEELAGFRADDAAPLKAAPRVLAPVLLIHGTNDAETPPRHSRAILSALGAADKRVHWVEGAGHADVMNRSEVWDAIERWVQAAQLGQEAPTE